MLPGGNLSKEPPALSSAGGGLIAGPQLESWGSNNRAVNRQTASQSVRSSK